MIAQLADLQQSFQPVQPAQELNVWGQIEEQLNQTFLSRQAFEEQKKKVNDEKKSQRAQAAKFAYTNEASTCSADNEQLAYLKAEIDSLIKNDILPNNDYNDAVVAIKVASLITNFKSRVIEQSLIEIAPAQNASVDDKDDINNMRAQIVGLTEWIDAHDERLGQVSTLA